MIEKDDWRLLNVDDAMKGIKLYILKKFNKYSDAWDHEHCEFCFAKFSELEGFRHEGYMSTEVNQRGTLFICDDCFDDFKEMLQWQVCVIENNEKREDSIDDK